MGEWLGYTTTKIKAGELQGSEMVLWKLRWFYVVRYDLERQRVQIREADGRTLPNPYLALHPNTTVTIGTKEE